MIVEGENSRVERFQIRVAKDGEQVFEAAGVILNAQKKVSGAEENGGISGGGGEGLVDGELAAVDIGVGEFGSGQVGPAIGR